MTEEVSSKLSLLTRKLAEVGQLKGEIADKLFEEEWNLFNIPERWKADEWDGHTPVEAANRLYRFSLYYDKWQY